MKKKMISFAMTAAVLATTVTGCSGSSALTGDEIVAEVGDTKISVGVAEFYARYEQAQYETYYMSYFGEDMWSLQVDGETTYEDNVKQNVLYALESMYVIEDHAGEYGVELTSAEDAEIRKAAKAFVEANDAEVLESISGTEDNVYELLRLYTVQQKMYTEMIKDADTEVSDDEAAQKSMDYAFFSFKTIEDGTEKELTDDEKEELNKTAEEFQAELSKGEKTFDECAEVADVTKSTLAFDAESVAPSSDLIKEADALEEGQVTSVVETEEGYYVAQVTSLFDREATDTEKESIVKERQEALYNDLCAEWMEAAEITEYDDIWEKVDFEKKGVAIKTEDAKDDSSEDETEE